MVPPWFDKAAVLSQDNMVVQSICTTSHLVQITGKDYAPKGSFQLISESKTSVYPLYLKPAAFSVELQTVMVASVVCNDATLKKEHEEWSILGDPTEGALLSLAGKADYFQHQWTTWLPRISKFSYTQTQMSVLCENKIADSVLSPLPESAPYFIFTKGSRSRGGTLQPSTRAGGC